MSLVAVSLTSAALTCVHVHAHAVHSDRVLIVIHIMSHLSRRDHAGLARQYCGHLSSVLNGGGMSCIQVEGRCHQVSVIGLHLSDKQLVLLLNGNQVASSCCMWSSTCTHLYLLQIL